jgi:histidine ammonia-lyase
MQNVTQAFFHTFGPPILHLLNQQLISMKGHKIIIDNNFTTLEELAGLNENTLLELSEAASQRIQKCRDYLDRKMSDNDELYYGINTGFGYLQNVRINGHQLEELQDNLIMSHACGMGDEVPVEIVRLMLLLKVKSLSYGNSGTQLETVQRLVDMFNSNILPIVYTQGSLGASGDLSPLSHLCLPLIGMGEVYDNGKRKDASVVLEEKGWKPIHLKSKEGLALINGTQFMSAYGIYNLIRSEKLINWANHIAAISFDGFDCVVYPFNENIHEVRSHEGQVKVASEMRRLLKDSAIASQKKSQVQDPYSFRCIPQVHGATCDTVSFVKSVFLKEINSVTDNPNIFPDQDLIVSGGNFHGQPLALTADFLSIAMSELASISERRTYQLISGLRGLPPFLVKEAGLNSGFMIPQYTAAGIVSENKQLSTPSSVDSIPSSINQEDHVSMGANGAVKCKRLVDNVEKVLAIELLTAVQALEFRRPLQSSPILENIVAAFREKVLFNHKDRILHHDMKQAVQFINKHSLHQS